MLNKSCFILGYYAASSGNFLPTFRDNLCSGVKILDPWTWEQFPSNSLQKPDIKQHAQPSTIFARTNVQATDVSGLPIGPI